MQLLSRYAFLIRKKKYCHDNAIIYVLYGESSSFSAVESSPPLDMTVIVALSSFVKKFVHEVIKCRPSDTTAKNRSNKALAVQTSETLSPPRDYSTAHTCATQKNAV